MTPDSLRNGEAVAGILAGAWRLTPTPTEVSPDVLERIAPHLVESGAGALVWWRLRQGRPQRSPANDRLRAAYRRHAIEVHVHEARLRHVLEILRRAGVDCVLCKGWSAARLYPEPGLRPYGDLDLCMPPEHVPIAASALTEAHFTAAIDLHPAVPELPDRRWGEIHPRSRVADVGGVLVRYLGAEDLLRLQCLHMMRHGVWRPLWLCDVAAAVESLPDDFDAAYFLSGDQRLTAWVLCALGLACRLLGARICDPLLARRVAAPPRWLVADVLRQWGSGERGDGYSNNTPIVRDLLSPARLLVGLRRRWAGPTVAAFQFGTWPRAWVPGRAYQIGDVLRRSVRWAWQMTAGLPTGTTPSVTIHKGLAG